MAIEIIMPKMGESITEGTIIEWKKKIGDSIEKDETILEISTDKVDSEVPSPGSGILLEINVEKNETVDVGTVIGYIGDKGEEKQTPKKNLSSIDSGEKVKNKITEEFQKETSVEISKPDKNIKENPKRYVSFSILGGKSKSSRTRYITI